MARIIGASIGLAFLLGCAPKQTAPQPPTAERGIARPAQGASQAAPADTKVFDSPDGDFHLQYPASWQLRRNTEHVRFDAGPRFGLDSAAVGTGQLPPGTTLDAFVEKMMDGFKGPGFEVKAPIERTTITLDGTPAVRLGIIAAMPTEGPGDFHLDVVVAVVNNKGYPLTCTTANASAAAAEPVFDRLIASMRFIK